MTLEQFLLARIDDDEKWARTALSAVTELPARPGSKPRIIAECRARRRIVEFLEGMAGDGRSGVTIDLLLRALAEPYSDHPDFRQEWRP